MRYAIKITQIDGGQTVWFDGEAEEFAFEGPLFRMRTGESRWDVLVLKPGWGVFITDQGLAKVME